MAIDSSVSLPLGWPRRHSGKLVLLAAVLLWLVFGAPKSPVFAALWEWSPALAVGFGQNILISLLAIAIGYSFFNEMPTLTTLIGAALVIVAGLLIIWRERKLGIQRSRQRKAMTYQA